ncbi:MAG: hypothetical protein KU38_06815 [Sulfurovum sp. FS08-3]|nr:MAG: hypothetical protein KU38_06815 [Sulfurovum sp. FS08-3]
MRHIGFLVILSLWVGANNFESHCKSCHGMERQLHIFMHRYTLKYSSKERIEKAMFEYIKNPQASNSIMPLGFITRWGVKKPTTLDDKTLKEAIGEYYRLYNLSKVWE